MKFQLFITTVLCISVLGCQSDAKEDQTKQEKAILALKALGARILVDENHPGKPVTEIWIDKKIPEEALSQLQAFPKLHSLLLCFNHIDDKGLQHLKGLVSLKRLDLTGNKITDAGLGALKSLTNLERLTLSSTDVTDAGVEKLKLFPKLRFLDLSDANVTDLGLACLKDLPNLE